ncbi:actin-like protein 9 [Gracilinanus agilis]|uniref:actin-like protein 9 n=1 Tax=Gracilinanus agilis TaxID=191870 RepID=UPI001CFDAFA0|nr:actin-like protein 9 [Gracilinanus agilis]
MDLRSDDAPVIGHSPRFHKGHPQTSTILDDVSLPVDIEMPFVLGDGLIEKTGAVVIDMGTGTCKSGFAGQAKPVSTVATVLGHLPEKASTASRPQLPTFIGECARGHPGLSLIQPLRNGIIVDWEAAETLWHYVFYNDLGVAPEDHPLLLSDPPFSPTTNREKLVEVVFESLHSPGMYVAYQSVLSVYAHGLVSGLVVDSGHGVTHTVPVYQGYNLPHATERLDLAGSHLTAFLAEMLRGAGYPFGERDTSLLESIKHQCCYVADDFIAEQNLPTKAIRENFRLPDGKVISLGKERFQCPELLFHPPEMPGLVPLGIPDMAKESLRKVPSEAREDISQNVLLCGGSSLFPGLEQRFSKELLQGAPPQTFKSVCAQPLRNYSVWIGGSILASLRAFQSCWIQRNQYEEQGPYIVYQKCY